jgi:ferredoxin
MLVPSETVRPERKMIINSAMYLLGLAGVAEQTKNIIQSKPTTIAVHVTSLISSPSSGSTEHFTDTCTAYNLCVRVCPSRVLVRSFLEFGFLMKMQPRMNFNAGHCNCECMICTHVCHSCAIRPLRVARAFLRPLSK